MAECLSGHAKASRHGDGPTVCMDVVGGGRQERKNAKEEQHCPDPTAMKKTLPLHRR
jgi:hypothetical protein